MTHKNKTHIDATFILVLLFSFIAIVALIIVIIAQTQNIVLKSDEVTIQLGSDLILAPDKYISSITNSSNNIDIDVDRLDNCVYEPHTARLTSQGKDYLDKGTYNITFVRSNNTFFTKNMTIRVKDTQKPEYTYAPKDIYIEQYADVDMAKYFSVKDFDSCSFTVDDTLINMYEQGSYPYKVVAEDVSGNQNIVTGQVHVVSQSYAEEHPDRLTRYEDGSLALCESTKRKIIRGDVEHQNFEPIKMDHEAGNGQGSTMSKQKID